MRRPTPLPAGPGQESGWDYPRPPRIEVVDRHVRVEVGGLVVADTRAPIRILETSHPPTYYVNPNDVELGLLQAVPGGTYCEWKGEAAYFDVVVPDGRVERAAWWYEEPTGDFADLKHHLAFYPALVACFVDGERVQPQPGLFYGGWITSDVVGPFKGEPGTNFW